jgi:predicted sugar kinase
MNKSVSVSVPARINMSAFNMNNFLLGKLCGGGIGFAIKLYTTIKLETNQKQYDYIKGAHSKIAASYINYFKKQFKISEGLNVSIVQQFEPHIGLSSSSAVAIGLICCINKLYSLNLTYNDMVHLHSSIIIEEFDDAVHEGFLSGVSSWVMCFGGMVIVDTNGELLDQYRISEENADAILIVTPKKIIKNNMFDEINLLKGAGTTLDLKDKVRKRTLFTKIKECFDKCDQKMGFILINQLLSLGSKPAELEYQNQNYNGLISELLTFGKDNNVLTRGMSSIGPNVFFLDSKNNISEFTCKLKSLNLPINILETSIHNDRI